MRGSTICVRIFSPFPHDNIMGFTIFANTRRLAAFAACAVHIGTAIQCHCSFAHFIFHPSTAGFIKEFSCKFTIPWEFHLLSKYSLTDLCFGLPKPPVNFQRILGSHLLLMLVCRIPEGTIKPEFYALLHFQRTFC